MKFVLRYILPLLILSAAVAMFATLRATKPKQPPVESRERVWQVELLAVAPASLAPNLVLYGQVETPSLYKGAASTMARVARVLVAEGERVSAGQLLVQLDERDLLPGLDQARADVIELEAQIESEQIRHRSDLSARQRERRLLELTQAAMQRARRLMDKKLGSDSDLDQAEQALARQRLVLTNREQSINDHPARLKGIEARLKHARARLAQQELAFERSRVTAPYAGIIAKLRVAEGNQVTANEVLLEMYGLDRLEVRARIPSPFQPQLQRAWEGGNPLPARSDSSGPALSLTFSRLAGEAQATGLDALFTVREGASWLRPGQVLRLILELDPQPNAVAIPYPAIYDGNRVYKLEQGRLRGVEVAVHGPLVDANDEERLLISSPQLRAGDRLVVTHLPNAVEGLRVEQAGKP